jgi:hypothetical protein
MHKRALWVGFVIGFLPVLLKAGPLDFVIGTQFAGLNVTQGAGWVPPDMGMAVGSSEIVQMVNGGYEIFNKSGGSLTGPHSDISLWTGAGVAPSLVRSGTNLSDPRAVYDPVSGRFIVAQINVTSGADSNLALIGISKTSNPFTGGWNALTFTATTGFTSGFADFPTLAFDQNGIFLGTNNFDNNSSARSTSVFSIPKSDLLLASPTLANMTAFTNLNLANYGQVPQPALDPFGSHGEVLNLGPNLNQATLYNINGAGAAGATLSAPTTLNGVTDNSTLCPRQADGSDITCDIDNRYSQRPVIVGNLMYAVNSFADPTDSFDIIHWMILDLTTKLILQQGTISDPGFDYTYPSVAANANGDFMIGFNRSGANVNGNMQAWAIHCRYDGTSATCGTPGQLGIGDNTSTGDGRWGDYSAIQVDPDNPNIFWTAIEVPYQNSWSTQITELILPTPEPGTLGLLTAGALLVTGLRRRRSVRER